MNNTPPVFRLSTADSRQGIVAPVGERFSQVLIRGRKEAGSLVEDYHTPCVFVPLIGEHGWQR